MFSPKNKNFSLLVLASSFYGSILSLNRLFTIVFLYKIFGDNFSFTFFLYGGIQIIQGVLYLFESRFVGRVGIAKSAIIGMILIVIGYLCIYLAEVFGDYRYLAFFAVLNGTGAFLYTLAHRMYFLEFVRKNEGGSRIGDLYVFRGILDFLLPFSLGYASSLFGASALFFVAFILSLPVIWVFFKLPEKHYDHNLKIKDICKDRAFWNILKYSFISSIKIPFWFLWSIWIFIYLEEKFDAFGAFLSVIFLATLIVAKLFGIFLDKNDKKKFFWRMQFLDGISWILRGFSFNIFFIFFVDTFGRILRMLHLVAFSTFGMSWMSSHGKSELFDERIVIQEMVICFGSGFMFFLLGGLLILETNILHLFRFLGLFYSSGYLTRFLYRRYFK